MNQILAEINNIFTCDEIGDTEKIDKSDALLGNALARDPQDTFLWMLRAIVAVEIPVVDYVKSIECLRQMFVYNPNHTDALVLLAYIQNTHEELSEEVKDALVLQLEQEQHPDKLSLLCLAISWYFFYKDFPMSEHYLKQSIQHCSTYVAPYWTLTSLYAYHEKNEQQIPMYTKQALQHLEVIYVSGYADDASIQQLKPLLGEKFQGFMPIETSPDVPDLVHFMKANIWQVYMTDIALQGVMIE